MVPDDKLELQPGRAEIRRRSAQKPPQSRGVPAKGAILDALLRAMHQRLDLPVGLVEAGEGLLPLPVLLVLPLIPALLVIASVARQSSLTVGGGPALDCRVAPLLAMTGEGQGAGTGQHRPAKAYAGQQPSGASLGTFGGKKLYCPGFLLRCRGICRLAVATIFGPFVPSWSLCEPNRLRRLK